MGALAQVENSVPTSVVIFACFLDHARRRVDQLVRRHRLHCSVANYSGCLSAMMVINYHSSQIARSYFGKTHCCSF